MSYMKSSIQTDSSAWAFQETSSSEATVVVEEVASWQKCLTQGAPKVDRWPLAYEERLEDSTSRSLPLTYQIKRSAFAKRRRDKSFESGGRKLSANDKAQRRGGPWCHGGGGGSVFFKVRRDSVTYHYHPVTLNTAWFTGGLLVSQSSVQSYKRDSIALWSWCLRFMHSVSNICDRACSRLLGTYVMQSQKETHAYQVYLTSWDLVIDLYYTDSYGLAVSIILEPHEWVQVEYFCGGRRTIALRLESMRKWKVGRERSSLLAIRMIRKLLETARKHSVVPRLVTVASDMHYWMTIKKDVIAGGAASPSCQTKAIAQRSRVMNHGYFDSKCL
ncbi:hypothetical protein EV421DRAFT_1735900 [Armillaria borealis]|uniref:Uncharacterized protein n=1 Tax=Armillaria borealis TaxID=47425 RepID=A0AA39JL28_9AGAR|nr:hypothetical protein EV421DRAFT_1735900 [Armillaria borealis]